MMPDQIEALTEQRDAALRRIAVLEAGLRKIAELGTSLDYKSFPLNYAAGLEHAAQHARATLGVTT